MILIIFLFPVWVCVCGLKKNEIIYASCFTQFKDENKRYRKKGQIRKKNVLKAQTTLKPINFIDGTIQLTINVVMLLSKTKGKGH